MHGSARDIAVKRQSSIVQAAATLTLGLGIGWLTGLSTSPVVGNVLAAVLGLGAGVVAGARSLRANTHSPDNSQRPEKSNLPERVPLVLDAVPAAILVLGIALGAPLGILARTYNIFGKAQVHTEALPSDQAPLAQQPGADNPGLYASHATACGEFVAKQGQASNLRQAMHDSDQAWARAVADQIQDPNTLLAIMESICVPSSSSR